MLSLFLIGTALPLLGQIQAGPAAAETRSACGQCEEPDRFVRLQDQSEVRHSAASRQFTHPFVLSPEEWTALLTALHVQRQAEGLLLPAFTAEEITYLSNTLSQAFAQAQPREMVVFGLSHLNAYNMTEVTTGGWFADGPSLHVVLANYRKVVTMPGTRQLLWQRPLRPDAGPHYDLVASTHQTIVQDFGVLPSLFSSVPSELSLTYQAILLRDPVETSAPRESPPHSSDMAPTPMSIEDRLRVLQRLYDQGLITDEEYRAKKQQILGQF